MIMNNGQNTRSYSPVPTEMSSQRTNMEDPKAKLKELVKKQIAHEVLSALTLADLASAYWKIGLNGHKHKLYCMAEKEFAENFDWRKYYYNVFEECPHIVVEYESKDMPKSMDEIYNKMYELHAKTKENLHEILKIIDENHIYQEMKILLDSYAKCEEHEEKLESKMKRAQVFGYDVAYILEKDQEMEHHYKEYKMHKDYIH